MPAGVSVTTPPEVTTRDAFVPRFKGLAEPTQTTMVNAAVMCMQDEKMDAEVKAAAKKFLTELFRHTP